MLPSPVLTPEFCLQVVIDATPHPGRFQKTDDPTVKKLFDLGVVDALSSAFFAQNVQAGIAPLKIDEDNIQSNRSCTVQEAADSVQTGARAIDTHDK